MSSTALILAGHGSHVSPNTGGLVWDYVDRLRRWDAADEITAAFWREQPAFSQVLDTVEADTVTVVPIFTAEGYFSTQVIPVEMGIAQGTTRREGRTIHYTAAISGHPGLSAIVRQRVDAVFATYGLDPSAVAIAIIGHGTGRSRQSKNAAIRQTEILRAAEIASDVLYAFLDDQPDIPSIYERTSASHVVVVPLFVAPGSHVSLDVPAALGLPSSAASADIRGKRVYYTNPVGSSVEEICTIILDQAHATDARFVQRSDSASWSGFPRVGASDLIQVVQRQGALVFGQLELRVNEVGPHRHDSSAEVVETPDALRAVIRENPFRPLATSDDLPGRWVVSLGSPATLPAVVETVYPGALADWHRQREGRFQAETLERIGERQMGMFRGIHELPHIERHVTTICGHCVRHATWFYGDSPPDTLPCKSPCNVWLSRVAEAVA